MEFLRAHCARGDACADSAHRAFGFPKGNISQVGKKLFSLFLRSKF